MKFVLASQNRGKLREMTEILKDCGVEIVLQSDLGVQVDVEENGDTFAANALLKAEAVMKATGLPAIADDSGLCVDALGGAPGVYTARYGGEGLTDPERYTLLLNNLRGQTDRRAHFHSAIACVFPDGRVLTAEGDCPGSIAFVPMGDGGFGYDPIFTVPEYKKTFSQLTAEEKNAVSHRGKALRAFAQVLSEALETAD